MKHTNMNTNTNKAYTHKTQIKHTHTKHTWKQTNTNTSHTQIYTILPNWNIYTNYTDTHKNNKTQTHKDTHKQTKHTWNIACASIPSIDISLT